MQKLKADQARKRKIWHFVYYKIHETSSIFMHAIYHSCCNVTPSARERQHRSCRVNVGTPNLRSLSEYDKCLHDDTSFVARLWTFSIIISYFLNRGSKLG